MTTRDKQTSATAASRRSFLKLSAGLAGGALGSSALSGCALPEKQAAAAPAPAPANDTGPGITVRTIAEAEKLHGLNYTDAEREQMLGGFEDQLERLARLRAYDKPNDLAPACTFDPRLPGIAPRPQDNTVRLAPHMVSDPGSEEDIAFASVKDLGRWLRAGALTSRALTEIYLARIASHGEALECFVTVTPERARAQAAEADRELRAGIDRGPLHGIPYVLKDIADTAGIPTTWGATPYKTRVPETDAEVTKRLREAGAVLLAKSTCGAIAYGDIWFGGTTRNPWNPNEGSSGSSAGSASATAAGLCAFSIGTETLGSIVSPSTRCGTTGLRPTFGRVSRSGFMALCWSLDKVGPICRYAEDTALVLAAINGGDVGDASSIAHGFAYDGTRDLTSLRVGYDPAWFEEASDTAKTALAAARDLGCTMTEISLPDLPTDSLFTVVLAESAAAFEELTLSNRDDDMVWQDDPAWPNSWRQVRLLSAVDYIQIERVRRRVMETMHEAFDGLDAMIGPNFAGSMLTITNFTGHPCLALKAGFGTSRTRTLFGTIADEDGPEFKVPETVSLWAPLFEEGTLVRLGHALEGALGVAGTHPDLKS